MTTNSNASKLARCIAVLGTGSDVGKSVITTALCRVLAQRGMRVAPFKAQNMSNNSGVTPDGLEMGRAQIVQAEAAGIVPDVDMNPILLKPTSEVGVQVVLSGRVWADQNARDYHQRKSALWRSACDALKRLRRRFDVVVLEGAGSCAEVNLMANDIVNLPMAAEAEAPAIVVGDIHRGGVFAQLVGTLACLPEDQRTQIGGFIVNRFRGDLSLFKDGVHWIEAHTGRPVFGVLPWLRDVAIDSEDSVVIEAPKAVRSDKLRGPAVAVLRLPHIANFTDMDALASVPGLGVHYLEKVQPLTGFAAVILPGSKHTRHDLDWLHTTGWAAQLKAYARAGGHVLGICGGYQMLGQRVADPHGVEGRPGHTPGLGLLPLTTVLKAPKTTTRTAFRWQDRQLRGNGYEIHMGQTELTGGRPWFRRTAQNGTPVDSAEGCVSDNDRIRGSYLHGFLDSAEILRGWLAAIGLEKLAVPDEIGWQAKGKAFDRLADHFRAHMDMERILALLNWRTR
ncbi:MAG: cobyric acid synthase [Desulfosarcinaceae bacterium]|jgi:adenosylcobyric acid synthase